MNFFIESSLTEFVVTPVSEIDGFPILTSRAPESLTYYSSTILRSNVDKITTHLSISGVTFYREWSTTITFDTTRRRNSLLFQDGGGTVIIVGSNPTAPPPIEISCSVSTSTNGVINNDVSTIPFDTDTKVRACAEAEESEDINLLNLLVCFSIHKILVHHILVLH